MSRFLKNILYRDRYSKGDEITNYLIEEIEDIVAKKVGDCNFRDQEYKNKTYSIKEHLTSERNNYIPKKKYLSHINYALQKEKPFKASRYINEHQHRAEFLPFEEDDIKPRIHNPEQIKSMVKKTLRPALNQWLDENLDIIIEKAIQKNYNKYLSNSKKSFHYYDEE